MQGFPTLVKCQKLMLSEYIKRKVKKMSSLNVRKWIKGGARSSSISPLPHPLPSICVQMFNDDVYITLLIGYYFLRQMFHQNPKRYFGSCPLMQLTCFLAFAQYFHTLYFFRLANAGSMEIPSTKTTTGWVLLTNNVYQKPSENRFSA